MAFNPFQLIDATMALRIKNRRSTPPYGLTVNAVRVAQTDIREQRILSRYRNYDHVAKPYSCLWGSDDATKDVRDGLLNRPIACDRPLGNRRDAFVGTEMERFPAWSVITSTSTDVFNEGGLTAEAIRGYKLFMPTGDNGVANFLDDGRLYDMGTAARIEAALQEDNLFFVARLNRQGTSLHADSNGCGMVAHCVAAGGPHVTDTKTAAAYVAGTIARAMAFLRAPVHSIGDANFVFNNHVVNVLFDASKDVVNGVTFFNPIKMFHVLADRFSTLSRLLWQFSSSSPSAQQGQSAPAKSKDVARGTPLSVVSPQQERTTETKTETETPDDKSVSLDRGRDSQEWDDIYQSLMRGQYASVGRVGVPTGVDAIHIDITEFGETRGFTMPAQTYRYEPVPVPDNLPLFGSFGMMYRAGFYPEIGLSFNDETRNRFISGSYYESKDFFGAYGSGGFRFGKVDNYRLYGQYQVVSGLDVMAWGHCAVARRRGALLDWQRGCDGGMGLSYRHAMWGGEFVWDVSGARFLGGSLSSGGRRYRIHSGYAQGQGMVRYVTRW